ncbi:MAG: hypothetical protein IJM14_07305 [Lachnospiraceae bacterium]|nr:hypothetical protein [Lachnospiraceae bacterium]
MNKLFQKLDKTVLGHKLLQDPLFRLLVTANMKMGWNALYSIFNGIMGLVYRSFWFVSMFAYYAVLSVMWFIVVSSKEKNKIKSLSKMMKMIGIGMVFLAIVVSGIVCMGIAEKRNPHYNIVIMITIAAYTFFIVIQAIINTVKAHKKKDLTVIMLRNISLASAIGSMHSLERSMLGTFGDADDRFSMIMMAISGAVAFLLVAAIGVLMIIKAGRIIEKGNGM